GRGGGLCRPGLGRWAAKWDPDDGRQAGPRLGFGLDRRPELQPDGHRPGRGRPWAVAAGKVVGGSGARGPQQGRRGEQDGSLSHHLSITCEKPSTDAQTGSGRAPGFRLKKYSGTVTIGGRSVSSSSVCSIQ